MRGCVCMSVFVCMWERVAEGASEPSGFLQWQQQMRERDEREQHHLQEQRHLEGKISHVEAALARTRITHSNQQRAHLKKEEVTTRLSVCVCERERECVCVCVCVCACVCACVSVCVCVCV